MHKLLFYKKKVTHFLINEVELILIIVLIFCSFGFLWARLFPLVSASGTGHFSFSPSSGTFKGCTSQSLSVNISVSGTTSNAADLVITYDPSKITVNSVSSTNAYQSTVKKTFGSGTIRVGQASFVSDFSGTAKFATINFTTQKGVSQAKFTIAYNGSTTQSNIASADTNENILTSNGSVTYNIDQSTCPQPPKIPSSSSSSSSSSKSSVKTSSKSSTSSQTQSSSHKSSSSSSSSSTGSSSSSSSSSSSVNSILSAPVQIITSDSKNTVVINNKQYGYTDIPQVPKGQAFIVNGETLPNSDVTVDVFSNPIEYKTKSDNNGDWTISIDTTQLDNGSHHFITTIQNGTVTKTLPEVVFILVNLPSNQQRDAVLEFIIFAIVILNLAFAFGPYIIEKKLVCRAAIFIYRKTKQLVIALYWCLRLKGIPFIIKVAKKLFVFLRAESGILLRNLNILLNKLIASLKKRLEAQQKQVTPQPLNLTGEIDIAPKDEIVWLGDKVEQAKPNSTNPL